MKLFYSMQSELHEIYLMFLSQFNTLASEVKCYRIIEKRDLSNERNTFKSKTIFYHKRNKAKARARYKADPETKKASVRDSYKADPEKKKASVRDSYKVDPEKKKASVRDSYKARDPDIISVLSTATTQILNLSHLLKGSDIKRTSRRTALLKGSDIKRTSRRTVLLKGRNTRTIQLPLRHLKGIGIGMTPLFRLSKCAAERKRYRRGHRTTTTTQRYVMACCIALALKSYRMMCMQHVYSTHVRDLHKTIHFTCKACMKTQLLCTVLCDLCIEYWGVILNLMYKKASLSDVQWQPVCNCV